MWFSISLMMKETCASHVINKLAGSENQCDYEIVNRERLKVLMSRNVVWLASFTFCWFVPLRCHVVKRHTHFFKCLLILLHFGNWQVLSVILWFIQSWTPVQCFLEQITLIEILIAQPFLLMAIKVWNFVNKLIKYTQQ